MQQKTLGYREILCMPHSKSAGARNFQGDANDFAAKSREIPQKVIPAQNKVVSF
jgi:hypothetical protein